MKRQDLFLHQSQQLFFTLIFDLTPLRTPLILVHFMDYIIHRLTMLYVCCNCTNQAQNQHEYSILHIFIDPKTILLQLIIYCGFPDHVSYTSIKNCNDSNNISSKYHFPPRVAYIVLLAVLYQNVRAFRIVMEWIWYSYTRGRCYIVACFWKYIICTNTKNEKKQWQKRFWNVILSNKYSFLSTMTKSWINNT